MEMYCLSVKILNGKKNVFSLDDWKWLKKEQMVKVLSICSILLLSYLSPFQLVSNVMRHQRCFLIPTYGSPYRNIISETLVLLSRLCTNSQIHEHLIANNTFSWTKKTPSCLNKLQVSDYQILNKMHVISQKGLITYILPKR